MTTKTELSKSVVLATKRSDLKPESIRQLTFNNDDQICYRIFDKPGKVSYCPFGDKKQIFYRVFNDMHLFIAVHCTGTKSFVYRRYLNKRWRQLHLCNFSDAMDEYDGGELIKQAIARAANLHAAIERGENPFDQARAANLEPTLQEQFDVYLVTHLKKNGRNVDDTVKDFNRWFEKLAKRKASSITRSEVERFHALARKERGLYTANRIVQLLRAIYNHAIKKAKIFAGDNPAAGITLFDEEPRERFLSADEAAKLIAAFKDAPDEHCDFRTLKDFVLLSMLTGIRKSCLLSLEWNEIDFAQSILTIPPSKSKNKNGQIIPLGHSELGLLKERKRILKAANKEQSKIPTINFIRFVFPGTGKSGHVMDLKRGWTTLRKNINLSDITVHDLRRSLAAAMASQNVNVALIKGALNHKDLKTTLAVYARTNKQAELEARQLAHNSWFNAVDKLPEADNKINISTGKTARRVVINTGN